MSEVDCFPFYCVGLDCQTEEEAWSTFKKDADRQFRWIDGFKYWRTTPALSTTKVFDCDITIYRVSARLYALEECEAKGHHRAIIDGPYPEIKDPFEGVEAFGLGHAGD